jgi:hypothetical protein
MRYELKSKTVGVKTDCYNVVNEERNEKGEVTTEASQTKTGKCAYPVCLTLKDTESLNTSNFSVDIIAEVSAKLTLEKVDEEIENKTNEYLKSINP